MICQRGGGELDILAPKYPLPEFRFLISLGFEEEKGSKDMATRMERGLGWIQVNISSLDLC